MSAAALETRALRKSYGSVRALIPASFAIASGDMCLITGANGAGKSTLLRLLAGLAAPSAGALLTHGREVQASRADLRREVGYVGHTVGAYADLTCAENARLRAQSSGLSKKEFADRAEELVDAFAMRAMWHTPVRALSRGQKQRLALLLSLIHSPRILLWDEPTTGLDGDSVARCLAVLLREHQRGTTILLVTHDPDFQARLQAQVPCRSLTLREGRVAIEGESNKATAAFTPPKGSSWLREATVTFARDLRIEARTKETTGTSLAFGFIVFVLASLALQTEAAAGTVLASAALWISLALVGTVAIARVWNRERDEGALTGVLQSGASLSAFFWGKALATFFDLSVVSFPFAALAALFFRVNPSVFVAPQMLCLWTAGLSGFALVGTLFGALTVRTRVRDALLSIVLLPLLLPILLTCASASHLLFARIDANIWAWIRVVVAYDLLAALLATLFFAALIDSE